MAHILTDIGEELVIKHDLDAISTYEIGLYNDVNDSIGKADNLNAISEPSEGSYARQVTNLAGKRIAGDYGISNPARVEFDTSDETMSVDSYFVAYEFQAAGQGAPQDNLIMTGALSQTRNLSEIDVLKLEIDGCGLTIS